MTPTIDPTESPDSPGADAPRPSSSSPSSPSPEPAQPDLGPVTRRVAELLPGVADGHLDGPTPCPGMPVRDLLGHLLGLTLAFRAAARKEFGPLTDTDPNSPDAPPPSLDGDWRGRLADQLAELATAWQDPAAWRGQTRAGGIDLPGEVAGAVALNEVLVHGWDLARATGQPYDVDPAAAEVATALLAADADDPEARQGDPFGPALPVPAGATPLTRVIALAGRSPSWTPRDGA
ncbi:TIGR03086 family metal-binding protein [Streptomyces sp. DSM 44915]|uniref:TIGR03086 family metal-binding protein n=1 Tax=Streptomyces chisholmiae TaxID=3075540 RepID=A0ABU2JPN6_9ACTN|nr:TIGR03086 family metal-binding protein [Streptomyces sp. DSM 44915]MDT0266955.1 TIGR03086 family metal-binding protein [Streptomyces sp. DSM 44915]